MTFSYPLNFPTVVSFSEITVTLKNAVGSNVSPFTFEEQVYDFGGEVWELGGTLPPMTRETAEIYNSFLMSLKGRFGTFLMPIAGAYKPQGQWQGLPMVNGSNQTGNIINISGLTPNQSNAVVAGDFISIGSGLSTRLYKILHTVDSDATGNASLTIAPKLRLSPDDGEAVNFNNAMGLFRLNESQASYTINPEFYSIQFSCREAI